MNRRKEIPTLIVEVIDYLHNFRPIFGTILVNRPRPNWNVSKYRLIYIYLIIK